VGGGETTELREKEVERDEHSNTYFLRGPAPTVGRDLKASLIYWDKGGEEKLSVPNLRERGEGRKNN